MVFFWLKEIISLYIHLTLVVIPGILEFCPRTLQLTSLLPSNHFAIVKLNSFE